MADKPTQAEGGGNTFEQFLRDAPSASDVLGKGVVTLTGVVLRSEKAGMFVLAGPDGQTHEIPVDAVQRHEVVQDTPAQRIVQLQVAADRLPAGLTTKSPTVDQNVIKPVFHDHTFKEVITDPIADWKRPWWDWHTHPWSDLVPPKLPHMDPIPTLVENIGAGTLAENIGQPGGELVDPAVAGGLAPFVMATPHHAPQAAIAMQAMAGAQLQKHAVADQRTVKELIKDPIVDVKIPWLDGPHTHPLIDNPQTLPMADSPFTLVEAIGSDPTNTLAEGIGTNVPGGGVVNPAAAMAARAAYSQGAAQAFSPGAAQAALRTLPAIDSIQTIWYFDHHHTIKEMTKDPIVDPQTNPFNDGPWTWVEGIGGDPTNTLAEGVGVGDPSGGVINPAIWNLPGLMF